MTLTNTLRHTISTIISKFGESIILRKRIKTRNDQDDIIYTYEDKNIVAVVQIATLEDEQRTGGIIKAGNTKVYLKYNSLIEKGDLIKHQDIWYSINPITPVYVEGNLVYIECVAKRLNDYPSQPS